MLPGPARQRPEIPDVRIVRPAPGQFTRLHQAEPERPERLRAAGKLARPGLGQGQKPDPVRNIRPHPADDLVEAEIHHLSDELRAVAQDGPGRAAPPDLFAHRFAFRRRGQGPPHRRDRGAVPIILVRAGIVAERAHRVAMAGNPAPCQAPSAPGGHFRGRAAFPSSSRCAGSPSCGSPRRSTYRRRYPSGEGLLAVAILESGTVMWANAKAPTACTEGASQH